MLPGIRYPLRRWLAVACGLALVATGNAAQAGVRPGDEVANTPNATGTYPSSALGCGNSSTSAVTTDEVVLPTGDRVDLVRYADGRYSTTVDPAPRTDGYEVTFDVVETGGDIHVVPSDAAAFVPQVLDRQLFNVSKLADYGYHDGVPVVMSQEQLAAEGASVLSQGAGVSVSSAINNLGLVAADIDNTGRWWQEWIAGADAAADYSASAASTPTGVERVWLDEQLTVSLEDSVPQIGAPQVWDAGYDGTGMTVAVLDTGIDAHHPDLAGQVVDSENFTDDADGDEHGHGTHVAGTVAGTGVASDGQRVGVAPGAQVLDGQVCNAGGSCQMSAILDGMQWAVDLGADVVNISIGGPATDGTDPLSEAVNTLTAEHGTLFVVSAGNDGPSDQSVTRPATADAALAVGAVNKQEGLGNFSSRGPRVGDFALKPEVTAPGVAIVAPRGEGTSMGSTVDDYYTSSQGTSMAAPHAAGAAALVLQQYDELAPEQVKAVLATTAVPNDALDAYEQGGGRVDVAAALSAPVRAEQAVVDLGYFPYPQQDLDPVAQKVVYTNVSDEDVTLDFSVAAANRDGVVLDSQQLWLSADSVTIAAGEQEQVTVTVAPALLQHGWYGGHLVAKVDGETVLGQAVGFVHEEEKYELHLEVIDREGNPAGHHLTTVDIVDAYHVDDRGEDGFFELNVEPGVEAQTTLRLPAGTYSVMARVPTSETPQDPVGSAATEFVMVAEPEVEVAQETTLVLDARPAVEVTVETPDHPELRTVDTQNTFGWARVGEESGLFGRNWSSTGGRPIYMTPTESVTLGEFEASTRWRLIDPDVEHSSYLYDVIFSESEQVPDELHYVVHADELATIETAFYGGQTEHMRGEARHNWRPWVRGSSERMTQVPQGLIRTEFVSVGDTFFQQYVYGEPPFTGQMRQPCIVFPKPSSYEHSWHKGPARPGVHRPGELHDGMYTHRTGDRVLVRMQEWSDAGGNFGPRHVAIDESEFRVYQDDELITDAARAHAVFTASPDPGTLRLELDLARETDWWDTSTALRSVWTVTSEHTEEQEALPLLFVDYDIELDLTNTALPAHERRGPATVDLQVNAQPQANDPAAVAGAQAWISYDDGATWQERPTRPQGDGQFEVILPQRETGKSQGYVSLRTRAWDVDGNEVEQEIMQAWRLAAR